MTCAAAQRPDGQGQQDGGIDSARERHPQPGGVARAVATRSASCATSAVRLAWFTAHAT